MKEKELIDAMTNPESYPHTTGKIEVKETHISLVFLTGHFAYKVKKPLKFGGILDYSTLADRRAMCEKELIINRRLNEDMYLEVVDIVRGEDGKLHVGYGAGEVVEHAVKMKQMNQRSLLSEIIKRGEITDTTVKRVAAFMVDFFNRSDTTPDLATRYAEMTRKHLNATFDTLEDLGKNYGAWKKKFNDFMKNNRDTFLERTADGFVRDLHGDAHSRNFFIDGTQISLFDAIEFNDEFRIQDIAYEIAALAMDLDFNGLEKLSELYTGEYVRLSNDTAAKKLFPVYMFYWAVVRGEVELEKSAKSKNRDSRLVADKYFKLAEKYIKMF
ncbi:MAG: hypothetical protein HY516_04110 [Candidatus Aenigmarchaeota archaeon]|nr:hypothetical protein [Candidatus Aenigmarchaeota archaeon]